MRVQSIGARIIGLSMALSVVACATPSQEAPLSADARVTSEVQAALIQRLATDAVNIDVDTRESVVTLRGVVDGERERQIALDAAGKAIGVEKVIDRLSIRRGGADARELRPVEDDVF